MKIERRWSFRATRLGVAFLLGATLLACPDDEETGTGGADSGADATIIEFDVATNDAVGDDSGADATGSDVTEGDPEVDMVPPTPFDITFTTYNAGLALNFVPLTAERTPHVLDAIASSELGVLCLEEVWFDEDVAAVTTAAVQGNYPYSYHHVTEGRITDPPCTEEETTPLLACIVDEDCENSEVGLINCALSSCTMLVGGLSDACVECLGANSDKGVAELERLCVVEGGNAYFADGRNGVLILSQLPLVNPDNRVLSSFLIQRAVLHATVDVPGLGETEVFCTHVQTPQENVPYAGEYLSYEDEQAQQIQAIIDWAAELVGDSGRPVVLMGDWNTGPELMSSNIVAELGENFAVFAEAGYSAPYLDLETVPCTYCGDNNLNDGRDDIAIDHVFIRNFPDDVTYTPVQVFAGTVEITGPDGMLDTALSDHFGVSVQVVRE